MIKLISLLKETLAEAKFQDVAVRPAKGVQRGTSDPAGKSFDIIISNPDVIRKMAKTPMGYAGTIQVFSGDGPGSGLYKEYEWKPDTTEWTVWSNINYIILSEKNEVHWYNGKIPGGLSGVRKAGPEEDGSAGTDPKTGQKYTSGTPNKPLTALSVEKFGYKVYKALLLDPSVGHIISNKSATDKVKEKVYGNLIKDTDFIWITTGGDTYDTYDEIVVINPKYADVKKVKQDFETKHKGAQFFYSKNFPK